MEVCMKCQQSGINYLKDSTMYKKIYIPRSQATLRRTIFQRICVEIFLTCFVWVLCGPLAPPWGRIWSLLARLRPPQSWPIPVNTLPYFPWPSLLSWELAPSSPPSFNRHGVTGWEWTHTQANVCPLSKSQHWETFNIHNLSFREIQNI